MKTVVGIFPTSSAAERAAARLVEIGLPRARVRLLTPDASEREVHALVPVSETEQPGMGKAIGGVVGFVLAATFAFGVLGALRGGFGQLSTAVLLGTIVIGLCGALGGVFAGGSLENKMSSGLPKDEIYFYEDALRGGRSVVFAFAADNTQEQAARLVLERSGAESLDAGDESWRVGLANPEEVHPTSQGRRAS